MLDARLVRAGLSPLDEELGLRRHQRFTPRAEALIARLGATVPFAEAAEVLELAVGLPVSEPTARRHTSAAGRAALAVEETELERVEREMPVAANPPAPAQLSLDATTVPLRHGEWSEVKLGALAELVPGREADGQPVWEAVRLSYTARWESAERFGRTLTLEASRRGLDEAGVVVSPNDGAEWLHGLLDRIAPRAVRILDEPRAAEHPRVIGELVHGAGTAAASAWVAEQRHRLRTEPPAGVLAELARCQEQGPCATAPVGVDGLTPAARLAREVAYFVKRADQIRSAAFRAQQYPIGSGIVESGHRVIVGARFKGAGQHWNPCHLNPVLVLRTTICNGRWSTTWSAIAEQRAQTTRATADQTRRRRPLTRLVRCLQRVAEARPASAAAPLPPAEPAPAPAPAPPRPVPLSRRRRVIPAGPGWRHSNSGLFVPRSSQPKL